MAMALRMSFNDGTALPNNQDEGLKYSSCFRVKISEMETFKNIHSSKIG